ncbi:hypothetical protein [Schaalia odontolytica]|nr:hypothetical protein [Schaalia odontolytica]
MLLFVQAFSLICWGFDCCVAPLVFCAPRVRCQAGLLDAPVACGPPH